MNENSPIAITISRQIGSGAAYLGHQLAKRLGFAYVDREILKEAARRFNIPEEIIAAKDESVTPLLQSLIQSLRFGVSDIGYVPPVYMPSDREYFGVESEIIAQIAGNCSSVIIGRCGYYVLRNHPRHLSVFIHGSYGYRRKRIVDLYHVSEREAQRMIESNDREREQYRRTKTGQECMEPSLFHLCFDSSVLGLDVVEEAIIVCLRSRFGIEVPPSP